MNALLYIVKDDAEVINDYKNCIIKKLKDNNLSYPVDKIDIPNLIDKVKQAKFNKEQINLIITILNNSNFASVLRTATEEGFYDELVAEEVDLIWEEIPK